MLPRVTTALTLAWALLPGLALAGQDQELTERIKAALRDNPEIVLEALRQRPIQVYDIAVAGGEQKREQAWREQIAAAIKKPIAPAVGGPRAVLGRADAPVTIFEYTDFSCQACARNAAMVLDLLEAQPQRVRVFLKHNPSDEYARTAALHFEAIARQSPVKAWRFQELLFQRQTELRKAGPAALQGLLDELAVEPNALAKDLADPDLAKRIDDDMAEADRFHIKNTPSYVINGVLIEGAAPKEAVLKVMEMIEAAERKQP